MGAITMSVGLGEYVTAMQKRRQPTLINNIENNNFLLKSMREYDAIETEPGGLTLVEPMLTAENDTFQWYHGAQVLNTSYNPVIDSAEFEPKQAAIAVVINGREELMNRGPEAKIKLLKSRVKAAEYTMENEISAGLYSDGTGSSGLQIGGMKLHVSTTPTVGTVGGIDRSLSAAAFYRNFKFDTVNDVSGGAPGGVATSVGTIKQYLNYCINSTIRNEDRVKVLVMGQTHYEHLQGALQAIQIITDTNTARAGYKTLVYEGIPCILGGGINFGGQTQIAADRTYGLNTRFFKLRVYEGANMEPLPEQMSINQHAKVKLMIWMGNVTCSFPRGNFVMFDS